MTRAATRPGAGALDGVGQAMTFALAAGAALLAAPCLLLGAGLAHGLRRAGLRATWALPIATALLAPALALALSGHPARAATGAARRARAGDVDALAIAGALWPWWLAAAAATVALAAFRLQRRDRLHGGSAEHRAARATGPAQLAHRALARRRARGEGRAGHTVLGRDERGYPVLVCSLRAHAMIVGGSDTGKTTTAARLIEGEIAGGRGCVILDGKGGRHLPRLALALARRYRRPLALWSVLERFTPAPAIVIGSGGTARNAHAYWPLAHPITPEQATENNRLLAAALGACQSAVTSASAILRPPGTLNFKRHPPTCVTLKRCAPQRRSALAAIRDALPAPAPRPIAPATGRRDAAGDELLQIAPANYVHALTGQSPGRDHKICCPFHDDATASLHVYKHPAKRVVLLRVSPRRHDLRPRRRALRHRPAWRWLPRAPRPPA